MSIETFNYITQSVNAIGSLAIVGSFIFLFRRDKDKQAQINKLSGIASVLEAQNEIMIEQNGLVSQQVEILRSTQILKVNDNEALRRFTDIEAQKFKLSVKPILWLNGAGYTAYEGTLRVSLNNKGEEAYITKIEIKSEDINPHGTQAPFSLAKNEAIDLRAIAKDNKHINDCKYLIEISYEDKMQNKYLAIVEGKGASVKITENKEVAD